MPIQGHAGHRYRISGSRGLTCSTARKRAWRLNLLPEMERSVNPPGPTSMRSGSLSIGSSGGRPPTTHRAPRTRPKAGVLGASREARRHSRSSSTRSHSSGFPRIPAWIPCHRIWRPLEKISGAHDLPLSLRVVRSSSQIGRRPESDEPGIRFPLVYSGFELAGFALEGPPEAPPSAREFSAFLENAPGGFGKIDPGLFFSSSRVHERVEWGRGAGRSLCAGSRTLRFSFSSRRNSLLRTSCATAAPAGGILENSFRPV